MHYYNLSSYNKSKEIVEGVWALGSIKLSDDPPGLVGPVHIFYRLLVGNNVFYSKSYNRVKKRNSYTTTYNHGGRKEYGFFFCCG